MSALKLANIPVLIASGGLKIKPQIPFLELGGSPGNDIRTGNSVKNVEKVLQRAKVAGENLANTTEYLVIGESMPGGTTTALGVLSAMGIQAKGKISSSMPDNPHSLKTNVVNTGLTAAKLTLGCLKDNPIKAISCLGDPMMPALAGLVIGAAAQVPVLMAGGTQMTAILAIIQALKPDILCNVAIGTTRWIIQDESSDIRSIVTQINNIPILAADITFQSSRFPGLKIYETGIVKEGVGAGGSTIAAMSKLNGAITKDTILREVEKNYELLKSKK